MTREAVALVLTLAGGALAILGAFWTGVILNGIALGFALGTGVAGAVALVLGALVGSYSPPAGTP